MMAPLASYSYRAKVVSVYDGGTIKADIDLGFGIELKNRTLGLYGVTAPWLKGETRPAGLNSKTWLASRILDQEVTIITHKQKMGMQDSLEAEVFIGNENINRWMIDQGHAAGHSE